MIRLRTLAAMELRDSEGEVLRGLLAQPKRMALLAYLALATPRGFQQRDTLLALFWPEHDTDHERNSVNQSVHALGRASVAALLWIFVAASATACVRAGLPAAGATFDAVSEDLPGADTTHPERMIPVAITSGGQRMHGLVYVARGEGPHPTIVLVPGFEGHERNLDLAHAVRRTGWNTVFFHFRGTWGSEGRFSLANQLGDVRAVLGFLRSPDNARLRIDSRRVGIVGYSRGGLVALLSAAADSSVTCVAALAPWNTSRQVTRLRADSAAAATMAGILDNARGPTLWAPGDSVVADLLHNAQAYDPPTHAGALAGRRVLLVGASRDTVAPPEEYIVPLANALERASAQRITVVTLDSDHAFSGRRIALARALIRWLRSECDS